MRNTSEKYKEIIAGTHRFESKVVIGDEFSLIDEEGSFILFGDVRIHYDSDSGGYADNMLKSIKITQHLFTDDKPMVGCCVSAEIDVTMVKPTATIARMSSIKPFVRVVNDTEESEWIPKGIYYIDTRSDGENEDEIVLHGYDAMLKAENDFPTDVDVSEVPTTDLAMVQFIADLMGVELDERTTEIMQRGYAVQYPGGYSCREILGYIAAMYGGNFIMSDAGKLRLVRLAEIGIETNYLVDNNGYSITFGGVRLIV